jgi:hypothetical protein
MYKIYVFKARKWYKFSFIITSLTSSLLCMVVKIMRNYIVYPFLWTNVVKADGRLLMIIDHVDGVRLCLRTAATNGPIVYFPGDM